MEGNCHSFQNLINHNRNFKISVSFNICYVGAHLFIIRWQTQ